MRWVLIAFLLPDILMMPLAGRYGDYFGRRRLLFIGALVFALGALLSAASAGFGMLLASRAVEGLGAGVMFGGLLAIIADSFGERRLGRAFGTWGGLGAIAFGLSPFIAGVLIDGGGWRWLFAVNALLALAAAALVLRLLSEDRRGERPNWDPPGLLLLVAGLALSFLLAGASSAARRWPSSSVCPPRGRDSSGASGQRASGGIRRYRPRCSLGSGAFGPSSRATQVAAPAIVRTSTWPPKRSRSRRLNLRAENGCSPLTLSIASSDRRSRSAPASRSRRAPSVTSTRSYVVRSPMR